MPFSKSKRRVLETSVVSFFLSFVCLTWLSFRLSSACITLCSGFWACKWKERENKDESWEWVADRGGRYTGHNCTFIWGLFLCKTYPCLYTRGFFFSSQPEFNAGKSPSKEFRSFMHMFPEIWQPCNRALHVNCLHFSDARDAQNKGCQSFPRSSIPFIPTQKASLYFPEFRLRRKKKRRRREWKIFGTDLWRWVSVGSGRKEEARMVGKWNLFTFTSRLLLGATRKTTTTFLFSLLSPAFFYLHPFSSIFPMIGIKTVPQIDPLFWSHDGGGKYKTDTS